MFNKQAIEHYFNAEKKESLFFIGIGLLALLLAMIFLFGWPGSFYKGAAIPLALVGALLGVVGYTVYRRSDADRIRNVYAFDMNPSELKDKEWPRMQQVMFNFRIYRWTEIVLLLTGAGLYVYFIRDINNDFWRGFGLALAIMSLIALVADYFAEKRGKQYLDGLRIHLKG
ncbi:MAG: hypothetical protein KA229_14635 [Chitinophagaceae bacterium]|nr:hypothetical protein [Chitinophagaceae bacterium]